jgi:hypothetical protein
MQWMQTIDNIAEIARIPYLEVFNLGITDFLNLMSYLVYKNKQIEKQYKK